MSSSGCCSPALLTRMSSPPSSSTVCLTARSQKSLSPRSPAMVIALRPSFSTICLRLRRVVMLAQIEDRDVGAFAREQGGDRAADAAVGAGDQRDLALQPAGTRIARLPVGLGLELALVARQRVLVDHRLDDVGHVLMLPSIAALTSRSAPARPVGLRRARPRSCRPAAGALRGRRGIRATRVGKSKSVLASKRLLRAGRAGLLRLHIGSARWRPACMRASRRRSPGSR